MKAASDFDTFHRRTLPELLGAGWNEAAARGAAGLAPLAIRLSDGRAYTYRPDVLCVDVVGGEADAATVVELDETCWQGLCEAMETPTGLVLSQRARLISGDVADFLGWEPALRVLYEQLPPYDPSVPLLGSDGREIDPTRSFRPDDDPLQMAEFLRTAGYLLVRDVLPQGEVAELLQAAESLRDAACEGDRASYWGRHEDGQKLCTRVTNGGSDPRVRALPADPRMMRIVGLSDFDLEATDTEKIDILFKQSGMLFDGLADNPWHRDCGIGGHKVMCPIMNGSVFLRPANRETGELRFLPGSWKTAGTSVASDDHEIGVGIEAAPGDFALHYGDGMHAGPPPTGTNGPFRVSIVSEYGPRGRTAAQGQEHYDQLVLDVDTTVLR